MKSGSSENETENRNYASKPSESNSKRNAPVYLRKESNGQNWMTDCYIAAEEEKKRLIGEVRVMKKRKTFLAHTDGKIKKVKLVESGKKSALSNAFFLHGAVHCSALADQGSDVNIVVKYVLRALKAANKHICARDLPSRGCLLLSVKI